MNIKQFAKIIQRLTYITTRAAFDDSLDIGRAHCWRSKLRWFGRIDGVPGEGNSLPELFRNLSVNYFQVYPDMRIHVTLWRIANRLDV